MAGRRSRQWGLWMVALASIAAAVPIAAVKFVVDDIITFSFFLIFPVFYAMGMVFLLGKIFEKRPGVWKGSSVYALAALAIAATVLAFYIMDYKYTEYQALRYYESQGEDMTDMYLTLAGYLDIRSNSGATVGPYIIPFIPIEGFGILFIFDAIEFAIFTYTVLRMVRMKKRSEGYRPSAAV